MATIQLYPGVTVSREEIARIVAEGDKYASVVRIVRLLFSDVVDASRKGGDEFRDLLTMALAGVKYSKLPPVVDDGFLSGVERLVTYHLTSGTDGYVFVRVTADARVLLAAMDA